MPVDSLVRLTSPQPQPPLAAITTELCSITSPAMNITRGLIELAPKGIMLTNKANDKLTSSIIRGRPSNPPLSSYRLTFWNDLIFGPH